MTSDLRERRLIHSNSFRSLVLGFLLILALVNVGCLTSRVYTPVELPVKDPVAVSDLVSRINSLQEITQLKSSVSLQFADYKESKQGKGKIYPTAEGKLVLQRPQNIRMIVDATLVGRIADMGSDGERFTVAVFYPTERRSFIRGTNQHKYAAQTAMLSEKPGQQDVSTFSRLRPQHLTLPLLVPPVQTNSPDTSYFVIESRRDEPEVISKGEEMSLEVPTRRVLRTYYVLYVSRRLPDGRSVPIQCYWFDRTRQGTPLVRFQVFEEDGTLSTEAEYEGYAGPNGKPQPVPRSVKISRPHDGYAVRVTFRQTEVNSQPLSPEVFTLKNDENLRVFDLDAPDPNVRAKASEN